MSSRKRSEKLKNPTGWGPGCRCPLPLPRALSKRGILPPLCKHWTCFLHWKNGSPLLLSNRCIFDAFSQSLPIFFFGVVQSWAAILMGILAGSVPWVTMMILHKRSALLQKVDDTLGVFHTHAVAGLLGDVLTGLLAEPVLGWMLLPFTNTRGAFYGGEGGIQLLKQLAAAAFVIAWNIVSTTLILLFIRLFMPLCMPEEQLLIGDDAVHGEEAYALWGDGDRHDVTRPDVYPDGEMQSGTHFNPVNGARGVTIQL